MKQARYIRSTWHRMTHWGIARYAYTRKEWVIINIFRFDQCRLAFAIVGREPKGRLKLVPLEVGYIEVAHHRGSYVRTMKLDTGRLLKLVPF